MEKISTTSLIERIDRLLHERCERREDLAKVIGKNKQVFTDWKSKCIFPTASDLYLMAKHLGTTYDYLLLGETEQFPDDIAVIISKLLTLDVSDRELVINVIENVICFINEKNKKVN